MWPNHHRVVQKQGWKKWQWDAHDASREVQKWDIWLDLWVSWASNSTKKTQKRHSWKNVFSGAVQNAVAEATTTSDGSGDVRARRSNRAFWKGKVKAGSQKAPHLGQDSGPKGLTSEIQDQNYTYTYLLKGGLYVSLSLSLYIYIYTHFLFVLP